ncbi:MAG: terminase TerL endonuclease subunit [Devosia sp.]
MALRIGRALGKKGPRQRPRGVGLDATWDDDRQTWCVGEFWFDEATADKVVAFFPEHLTFTKGEYAGKPFVLEEWEEDDIIRPLFGWKRADGTRRYRRCYVWIARKNGKSELAAGIALLMLMGDAELGGEVYSLASNEDQARIVFDRATAMVQRSPTLSGLLDCFTTSIYCAQLNAAFKPISGVPKGKHGFSTSGMIGDEIHEWKSGDLYQFLHDAEGSRRQPLEFLISTAGEKGTHGEVIWQECQNILDGTDPDLTTLVVVYAADAEDDWKDPAVWAKANPALGKGKKLDALEAEAREAMQKPRLENNFRRYQLNQWTEQAVRWLAIDAVDSHGRQFGWDHCKGPVGWKDLRALLQGKRCYSGIDLSSIIDLSSLMHWFPVQDGLDVPVVLGRFYKPKDYLEEHSKRDKLPYKEWAESGALTATDGNVVDYDFVQRDLLTDWEEFDIGGIGIDKYNATQFAVSVQKLGLPIEFFSQGIMAMNPPSKELERLVIANGLHHGGHPILRQHAKVVRVKMDEAENIKPVKNEATGRIDGIVGTVIAIGMATLAPAPAAKSFWETMATVAA